MPKPCRERYEQIELGALLVEYGGLKVVPSRDDDIIIRGNLDFRAEGPESVVIEDAFDVEIRVSPSFPDDIPVVWETGGRVPRDFHCLTDGSLCLGAPTEIRMMLRDLPTLPTVVRKLVIPYFYGFLFYQARGIMPFGELAHGDTGIRQALAAMFRATKINHAEDFLRLAGMKSRLANKHPCPCGSGKRLGKCHNRRVNAIRNRYGRIWLRQEFERVVELLR